MFNNNHYLITTISILLSACLDAQCVDKTEKSFIISGSARGLCADSWTIATEDTRLTVGATTTGELYIYEVSNPAAGWNWTAIPSVFGLLDSAGVEGKKRHVRWKYKDGVLDKTDGQKVTICFICENPVMELKSVWWARPGRGPVQHTMKIINQSDKPVELFKQPTIHMDISGPSTDVALTMWTFHSDGGTPDKYGVYQNSIEPPFYREVCTNPNGEFLPYAVFDAGSNHGIYIGIEWSYCRISAISHEGNSMGAVRVLGGEADTFRINLVPGEAFLVPPGFIGAYLGDIDEAGNSLRKYLFNYNLPEIVRMDTSYPKVQWNAFGATGDKPGSWNSVEVKYYPLIDDITPLGFEEVMLDVGWWKGGTIEPDPFADPVDWPSGMAKAAEYAHKAGLRFGLYWNKGEEMASQESRDRRMTHIKKLYNEYNADMWRSDGTGGPVVSPNYLSVNGFYSLLDQLSREIPNFQWENCNGGGRIKDFGAMSRCVKIFMTDTYSEIDVRKAFYDGSFVLPPVQLMGCLGSSDGLYCPTGADGMKYSFRSMSMGAPEWFFDAPNGSNGCSPWIGEEKAIIKAAVATYKEKIRPLVRNADLYHILPRPDGMNWDGIQYYDPVTGKGVIYLFKSAAGTDRMVIKLRGVKPGTTYRVTFEDATNPVVERTGDDLTRGIEIVLRGAPVSELIFLDAVQSVDKPVKTTTVRCP